MTCPWSHSPSFSPTRSPPSARYMRARRAYVRVVASTSPRILDPARPVPAIPPRRSVQVVAMGSVGKSMREARALMRVPVLIEDTRFATIADGWSTFIAWFMTNCRSVPRLRFQMCTVDACSLGRLLQQVPSSTSPHGGPQVICLDVEALGEVDALQIRGLRHRCQESQGESGRKRVA